MELGIPPVSQRAGWFQGRADAFSGSVVEQPVTFINVTPRSRRENKRKLTRGLFTIRDAPG
jgi:hypothetical protein